MRRVAPAVFSIALLCAAASPASAQLGGLIKKVPKVPTPPVPVPIGAPAQSAPAQPASLLTSCEQLKRMIEALEAERQALEQGTREASAAQSRIAAEKAAGGHAQQERIMDALEASTAKEQKHKDCLDAAMLKDPDNPKLERLEMAAEDEMDDAKADKLNEQAEVLRKAIQQRAEPGCAALKTDMGADLQAVNAAEQARREREERLISGVNAKAEQAGAKTAGMSETDYAKLKEDLCVAVVSKKFSAGDQSLIDSCGTGLEEALRAVGCGSGSPWGAPTPAIK